MLRFDFVKLFNPVLPRMKAYLATLLLMAPLAVHAEVLDKELSLTRIILAAAISAICSYLAARYRPWLLVVVVLLSGWVFFPHLLELTNSEVGLAMVTEGGSGYVAASWLAPAFSLVATALGFGMRFRRGKVGA